MDLSLRDLAERSRRLGADALAGRARRDEPDAADRRADRRRASSCASRSCCASTRTGTVTIVRAGERRRGGARRPPLRDPHAAAARPARRGLAATRSRPGAAHRRPRRPADARAGRARDRRGRARRASCSTSTATRHELAAGDCVTFDADLPHHFENHGRRRPSCWPSCRRGCAAHDRPPRCSTRSGPRTRSRPACIYIDLHLVHEVTSPQAFDGLRLAGRTVRRPDRTLATADHNVPTDGTPVARADRATSSRACRSRRSSATATEFGIPLYSLGSERQGIVHVIGPELGVTQPGMTIVCGDSHTATHGAFGALAFGIGTSEVEHVLATQTPAQRKPKSMRDPLRGRARPRRHREGPDPRHDRPDGHRRRRRPRRRVRGPGRSRRSRWRAG